MNYQPLCLTEVQFISKENMQKQLLKLFDLNIVIILSTTSAMRWNLDLLPNAMKQQNSITWINDAMPNPTQDDIQTAWKKIGIQKVDLIIALGGGSAIDLAKAISAFYEFGAPFPSTDMITARIEQKTYLNRNEFIDIIAIPTTAGTGSELTPWATIWDSKGLKKYSVDHPNLKPKKAFIVPELTLTLSKEMTLATGLDALSHAMEAYWSKHTNPLVQDLAYRGIQLMIMNLSKVLDNPNHYVYRENLCRASVLAGLAFSVTRTTACHSISYPMTMQFGVPHGLAAAITLGAVGKRNQGHFPNDQALYELFQPYGGIQSWLDGVSKGILRLRLSSFHITQTDLRSLANNAFTAGRMDNNPVILSEDDVYDLLLDLLE